MKKSFFGSGRVRTKIASFNDDWRWNIVQVVAHIIHHPLSQMLLYGNTSSSCWSGASHENVCGLARLDTVSGTPGVGKARPSLMCV